VPFAAFCDRRATAVGVGGACGWPAAGRGRCRTGAAGLGVAQRCAACLAGRGLRSADVIGRDTHPVEAARRVVSRHVVDVYLYGEGAPDMCGIPTRRLNWATRPLARRGRPRGAGVANGQHRATW
jgi:hypothetical protein